MTAPLENHPLFVYGTLLFDEVVEPLLGRLPESSPAVLEGHQVRRLPGVVWPGLIEQPGQSVLGRVLTDLAPGDRLALDSYEDDYYDLVAVDVTIGPACIRAATYRVSPALVGHEVWSPEWFARAHLDDYVAELLT